MRCTFISTNRQDCVPCDLMTLAEIRAELRAIVTAEVLREECTYCAGTIRSTRVSKPINGYYVVNACDTCGRQYP